MAGSLPGEETREFPNPHLGGVEQSAFAGVSLPERFIATTLARIDGGPQVGKLTLAPALEVVGPVPTPDGQPGPEVKAAA